MRILPGEVEFAEFLLKIGDGIANNNKNDLLLPENCIDLSNIHIAENVYGQIIRSEQFETLTKMAMLSARNVYVDDIIRRVV